MCSAIYNVEKKRARVLHALLVIRNELCRNTGQTVIHICIYEHAATHATCTPGDVQPNNIETPAVAVRQG